MVKLKGAAEPQQPSAPMLPLQKPIAESSMEPSPPAPTDAVPIYKSRSLEILTLCMIVTLLVALGTAVYLRDSIKSLETKIALLESPKITQAPPAAPHDTSSLELVAKITDILKDSMGALSAERREVERLRQEIDLLKTEKQKISGPQISSPPILDNVSPSTH